MSVSGEEEERFVLCRACGKSYVCKTHQDVVRHKTSTLHLMALPVDQKASNGGLANSRCEAAMPKGYRLLKRQGWDGVSGLGKRKTGISQPVAAHKRARNRAGIGAERRQPPRKGKDAKPCQPSTPKETPQEVQTRWKRLQLELSTDLSDDYIEVLLAPDNCGETEKQRKNRKRKRRKRKW